MKLKLSELPKQIKWLLAAYEMFRRLDFQPEELYFGCDGTVIYVQLRHNDLTFTWADSAEGMSEDTFISIWPAAAEAWNNSENGDAIAIFEESRVKEKSEDLIMALLKKGITPPIIVN